MIGKSRPAPTTRTRATLGTIYDTEPVPRDVDDIIGAAADLVGGR